MRDYIIATDSCCDFDENLIRELDLTVIPLSVHLGQDHFRNYPGEMPESHVFYTRLSKGEPAQTSAPNVEAFKDAFRPFLEAGKDVLYLGFSSALSATYQNAAMAVEELRCDSRGGYPLCLHGARPAGGSGSPGKAEGEVLGGSGVLCPGDHPPPLPLVYRGGSQPAAPGWAAVCRQSHCGEPAEH